MASKSHTPGPWHAIGDAIYSGQRGQNIVASCDVGEVNWGSRRENAGLIAAAPEMLQALKALNEFILGKAESNASGNPEWEAVSKRINAARAAIAKAEAS